MLLDSSAVLALVFGEPGAEMVAEHLTDAAVLSVNLAECVSVARRKGVARSAFAEAVAALALPVVDFTEPMAWLAGERRAELPSGLGIADACCLAAAAVRDVEVMTTDRVWREVAPAFGARVVLIR